MRLAHLIPAIALAAFAACDAATESTCSPGASVACTCTDAAQGARACNDEGTALLPCSCEPPGAEADAMASPADALAGDALAGDDAGGIDAAATVDVLADALPIEDAPHPTAPCLEASPTSIDFGAVAVGTEATGTLTLVSCGDTPVEITDVALQASPEGSPFTLHLWSESGAPLPGEPLATLSPGQSLDVVLAYAPTAPAAEPDVSSLRIEATGVAPIEVAIQGTATGANDLEAIATLEETTTVPPQTTLHLRGDQSLAAVGAVARYEWTVEQPVGSVSAFVPSADVPNPTFVANVAGDYTFNLVIFDEAEQESAPAVLAVMVVPDEVLHVELLWETPNDPDQTDSGPEAGTDLDLHFVHPDAGGPDLDGDGAPDGWLNQPFDCFWFNPHPDWASFDPAVDDDPGLDLDDTDGAGPENLNLNVPEDGVTYRVGVHYWNDHKFGPSYATLRVYLYGELAWEQTGVKLFYHDMWEAVTIEWPSGTITEVKDTYGGAKITPNYESPFFFQP